MIFKLLLLLYFSLQPLSVYSAVSKEQQSMAEHLLQQSISIQSVQYQLTVAGLEAESLISDPALFHNFRPLPANKLTLRVNEKQNLWLLVKVVNPYSQPWDALLYYPFLPVDRLNFYQLQPDVPTVTILSKGGSLLPYSERALPLRGYSQQIHLPAGGEGSYLLRIQDAALVSTELKLGILPIIWQEEQHQQIGDALLSGALLLLVVFMLAIAKARRSLAYVCLAGFYGSFMLVTGVLNGQAFSMLWPGYPELNPVMLYITVGLCLVALTGYCRLTLLRQAGRWSRLLNTLAMVSALILLFSPLFADGELKLRLLFSCVSITLSLCIVQALMISLSTEQIHAPRYAMLSTLAALCLLLVQTRHLAGLAEWLNTGLFLLLVVTTLVLPQQQRLQD